jgi:hypothetical protein
MNGFDYSKYLDRGVLKLTGPVYAYEFDSSDFGNKCFWHLSIWLHGNDITDFKIMYDRKPESRFVPKPVMLFGQEQDLADFSKWWVNYKTRFPVRSGYRPTVPMGETITLTTVECRNVGNDLLDDLDRTELNVENPESKAFEDWAWIAHHTKSKVWVIPGAYLFQDSSEAVLFKLSQER